MRHSALGLTLAALTLLPGCNSMKWNFFRKDAGNNDYRASTEVPSKEALVNYLNDNADRVKSIQCNHLELQCTQGIRPLPALHGRMVCQKPRDFRMMGTVFGKEEIDVGSNSDEFWFWVARGQPYQFHCSHRALEEGKVTQMPFPIQPDWIIEAMGLAKYDSSKPYQVVAKQNTVELIETTRSPEGKEVLKVTEFRRGRVQEGQAQVSAHRLIDKASGKEICSAQVVQVRVDRATGAIIPRRVVLYCPEDKLKLAMTLDEVTVKGPKDPPLRSDLLFQRRPLRGVRSYDLAERRFDDPIQRVEGRQ